MLASGETSARALLAQSGSLAALPLFDAAPFTALTVALTASDAATAAAAAAGDASAAAGADAAHPALAPAALADVFGAIRDQWLRAAAVDAEITHLSHIDAHNGSGKAGAHSASASAGTGDASDASAARCVHAPLATPALGPYVSLLTLRLAAVADALAPVSAHSQSATSSDTASNQAALLWPADCGLAPLALSLPSGSANASAGNTANATSDATAAAAMTLLSTISASTQRGAVGPRDSAYNPVLAARAAAARRVFCMFVLTWLLPLSGFSFPLLPPAPTLARARENPQPTASAHAQLPSQAQAQVQVQSAMTKRAAQGQVLALLLVLGRATRGGAADPAVLCAITALTVPPRALLTATTSSANGGSHHTATTVGAVAANADPVAAATEANAAASAAAAASAGSAFAVTAAAAAAAATVGTAAAASVAPAAAAVAALASLHARAEVKPLAGAAVGAATEPLLPPLSSFADAYAHAVALLPPAQFCPFPLPPRRARAHAGGAEAEAEAAAVEIEAEALASDAVVDAAGSQSRLLVVAHAPSTLADPRGRGFLKETLPFATAAALAVARTPGAAAAAAAVVAAALTTCDGARVNALISDSEDVSESEGESGVADARVSPAVAAAAALPRSQLLQRAFGPVPPARLRLRARKPAHSHAGAAAAVVGAVAEEGDESSCDEDGAAAALQEQWRGRRAAARARCHASSSASASASDSTGPAHYIDCAVPVASSATASAGADSKALRTGARGGVTLSLTTAMNDNDIDNDAGFLAGDGDDDDNNGGANALDSAAALRPAAGLPDAADGYSFACWVRLPAASTQSGDEVATPSTVGTLFRYRADTGDAVALRVCTATGALTVTTRNGASRVRARATAAASSYGSDDDDRDEDLTAAEAAAACGGAGALFPAPVLPRGRWCHVVLSHRGGHTGGLTSAPPAADPPAAACAVAETLRYLLASARGAAAPAPVLAGVLTLTVDGALALALPAHFPVAAENAAVTVGAARCALAAPMWLARALPVRAARALGVACAGGALPALSLSSAGAPTLTLRATPGAEAEAETVAWVHASSAAASRWPDTGSAQNGAQSGARACTLYPAACGDAGARALVLALLASVGDRATTAATAAAAAAAALAARSVGRNASADSLSDSFSAFAAESSPVASTAAVAAATAAFSGPALLARAEAVYSELLPHGAGFITALRALLPPSRPVAAAAAAALATVGAAGAGAATAVGAFEGALTPLIDPTVSPTNVAPAAPTAPAQGPMATLGFELTAPVIMALDAASSSSTDTSAGANAQTALALALANWERSAAGDVSNQSAANKSVASASSTVLALRGLNPHPLLPQTLPLSFSDSAVTVRHSVPASGFTAVAAEPGNGLAALVLASSSQLLLGLPYASPAAPLAAVRAMAALAAAPGPRALLASAVGPAALRALLLDPVPLLWRMAANGTASNSAPGASDAREQWRRSLFRAVRLLARRLYWGSAAGLGAYGRSALAAGLIKYLVGDVTYWCPQPSAPTSADAGSRCDVWMHTHVAAAVAELWTHPLTQPPPLSAAAAVAARMRVFAAAQARASALRAEFSRLQRQRASLLHQWQRHQQASARLGASAAQSSSGAGRRGALLSSSQAQALAQKLNATTSALDAAAQRSRTATATATAVAPPFLLLPHLASDSPLVRAEAASGGAGSNTSAPALGAGLGPGFILDLVRLMHAPHLARGSARADSLIAPSESEDDAGSKGFALVRVYARAAAEALLSQWVSRCARNAKTDTAAPRDAILAMGLSNVSTGLEPTASTAGSRSVDADAEPYYALTGPTSRIVTGATEGAAADAAVAAGGSQAAAAGASAASFLAFQHTQLCALPLTPYAVLTVPRSRALAVEAGIRSAPTAHATNKSASSSTKPITAEPRSLSTLAARARRLNFSRADCAALARALHARVGRFFRSMRAVRLRALRARTAGSALPPPASDDDEEEEEENDESDNDGEYVGEKNADGDDAETAAWCDALWNALALDTTVDNNASSAAADDDNDDEGEDEEAGLAALETYLALSATFGLALTDMPPVLVPACAMPGPAASVAATPATALLSAPGRLGRRWLRALTALTGHARAAAAAAAAGVPVPALNNVTDPAAVATASAAAAALARGAGSLFNGLTPAMPPKTLLPLLNDNASQFNASLKPLTLDSTAPARRLLALLPPALACAAAQKDYSDVLALLALAADCTEAAAGPAATEPLLGAVLETLLATVLLAGQPHALYTVFLQQHVHLTLARVLSHATSFSSAAVPALVLRVLQLTVGTLVGKMVSRAAPPAPVTSPAPAPGQPALPPPPVPAGLGLGAATVSAAVGGPGANSAAALDPFSVTLYVPLTSGTQAGTRLDLLALRYLEDESAAVERALSLALDAADALTVTSVECAVNADEAVEACAPLARCADWASAVTGAHRAQLTSALALTARAVLTTTDAAMAAGSRESRTGTLSGFGVTGEGLARGVLQWPSSAAAARARARAQTLLGIASETTANDDTKSDDCVVVSGTVFSVLLDAIMPLLPSDVIQSTAAQANANALFAPSWLYLSSSTHGTAPPLAALPPPSFHSLTSPLLTVTGPAPLMALLRLAARAPADCAAPALRRLYLLLARDVRADFFGPARVWAWSSVAALPGVRGWERAVSALTVSAIAHASSDSTDTDDNARARMLAMATAVLAAAPAAAFLDLTADAAVTGATMAGAAPLSAVPALAPAAAAAASAVAGTLRRTSAMTSPSLADAAAAAAVVAGLEARFGRGISPAPAGFAWLPPPPAAALPLPGDAAAARGVFAPVALPAASAVAAASPAAGGVDLFSASSASAAAAAAAPLRLLLIAGTTTTVDAAAIMRLRAVLGGVIEIKPWAVDTRVSARSQPASALTVADAAAAVPPANASGDSARRRNSAAAAAAAAATAAASAAAAASASHVWSVAAALDKGIDKALVLPATLRALATAARLARTAVPAAQVWEARTGVLLATVRRAAAAFPSLQRIEGARATVQDNAVGPLLWPCVSAAPPAQTQLFPRSLAPAGGAIYGSSSAASFGGQPGMGSSLSSSSSGLTGSMTMPGTTMAMDTFMIESPANVNVSGSTNSSSTQRATLMRAPAPLAMPLSGARVEPDVFPDVLPVLSSSSDGISPAAPAVVAAPFDGPVAFVFPVAPYKSRFSRTVLTLRGPSCALHGVPVPAVAASAPAPALGSSRATRSAAADKLARLNVTLGHVEETADARGGRGSVPRGSAPPPDVFEAAAAAVCTCSVQQVTSTPLAADYSTRGSHVPPLQAPVFIPASGTAAAAAAAAAAAVSAAAPGSGELPGAPAAPAATTVGDVSSMLLSLPGPHQRVLLARLEALVLTVLHHCFDHRSGPVRRAERALRKQSAGASDVDDDCALPTETELELLLFALSASATVLAAHPVPVDPSSSSAGPAAAAAAALAGAAAVGAGACARPFAAHVLALYLSRLAPLPAFYPLLLPLALLTQRVLLGDLVRETPVFDASGRLERVWGGDDTEAPQNTALSAAAERATSVDWWCQEGTAAAGITARRLLAVSAPPDVPERGYSLPPTPSSTGYAGDTAALSSVPAPAPTPFALPSSALCSADAATTSGHGTEGPGLLPSSSAVPLDHFLTSESADRLAAGALSTSASSAHVSVAIPEASTASSLFLSVPVESNYDRNARLVMGFIALLSRAADAAEPAIASMGATASVSDEKKDSEEAATEKASELVAPLRALATELCQQWGLAGSANVTALLVRMRQAEERELLVARSRQRRSRRLNPSPAPSATAASGLVSAMPYSGTSADGDADEDEGGARIPFDTPTDAASAWSIAMLATARPATAPAPTKSSATLCAPASFPCALPARPAGPLAQMSTSPALSALARASLAGAAALRAGAARAWRRGYWRRGAFAAALDAPWAGCAREAAGGDGAVARVAALLDADREEKEAEAWGLAQGAAAAACVLGDCADPLTPDAVPELPPHAGALALAPATTAAAAAAAPYLPRVFSPEAQRAALAALPVAVLASFARAWRCELSYWGIHPSHPPLPVPSALLRSQRRFRALATAAAHALPALTHAAPEVIDAAFGAGPWAAAAYVALVNAATPAASPASAVTEMGSPRVADNRTESSAEDGTEVDWDGIALRSIINDALLAVTRAHVSSTNAHPALASRILLLPAQSATRTLLEHDISRARNFATVLDNSVLVPVFPAATDRRVQRAARAVAAAALSPVLARGAESVDGTGLGLFPGSALSLGLAPTTDLLGSWLRAACLVTGGNALDNLPVVARGAVAAAARRGLWTPPISPLPAAAAVALALAKWRVKSALAPLLTLAPGSATLAPRLLLSFTEPLADVCAMRAVYRPSLPVESPAFPLLPGLETPTEARAVAGRGIWTRAAAAAQGRAGLPLALPPLAAHTNAQSCESAAAEADAQQRRLDLLLPLALSALARSGPVPAAANCPAVEAERRVAGAIMVALRNAPAIAQSATVGALASLYAALTLALSGADATPETQPAVDGLLTSLAIPILAPRSAEGAMTQTSPVAATYALSAFPYAPLAHPLAAVTVSYNPTNTPRAAGTRRRPTTPRASNSRSHSSSAAATAPASARANGPAFPAPATTHLSAGADPLRAGTAALARLHFALDERALVAAASLEPSAESVYLAASWQSAEKRSLLALRRMALAGLVSAASAAAARAAARLPYGGALAAPAAEDSASAAAAAAAAAAAEGDALDSASGDAGLMTGLDATLMAQTARAAAVAAAAAAAGAGTGLVIEEVAESSLSDVDTELAASTAGAQSEISVRGTRAGSMDVDDDLSASAGAASTASAARGGDDDDDDGGQVYYGATDSVLHAHRLADDDDSSAAAASDSTGPTVTIGTSSAIAIATTKGALGAGVGVGVMSTGATAVVLATPGNLPQSTSQSAARKVKPHPVLPNGASGISSEHHAAAGADVAPAEAAAAAPAPPALSDTETAAALAKRTGVAIAAAVVLVTPLAQFKGVLSIDNELVRFTGLEVAPTVSAAVAAASAAAAAAVGSAVINAGGVVPKGASWRDEDGVRPLWPAYPEARADARARRSKRSRSAVVRRRDAGCSGSDSASDSAGEQSSDKGSSSTSSDGEDDDDYKHDGLEKSDSSRVLAKGVTPTAQAPATVSLALPLSDLRRALPLRHLSRPCALELYFADARSYLFSFCHPDASDEALALNVIAAETRRARRAEHQRESTARVQRQQQRGVRWRMLQRQLQQATLQQQQAANPSEAGAANAAVADLRVAMAALDRDANVDAAAGEAADAAAAAAAAETTESLVRGYDGAGLLTAPPAMFPVRLYNTARLRQRAS